MIIHQIIPQFHCLTSKTRYLVRIFIPHKIQKSVFMRLIGNSRAFTFYFVVQVWSKVLISLASDQEVFFILYLAGTERTQTKWFVGLRPCMSTLFNHQLVIRKSELSQRGSLFEGRNFIKIFFKPRGRLKKGICSQSTIVLFDFL